ncbi:hypothetical protein WL29_21875 [Burkholderia ubonensis]|uniref:Uncharacterized protein n=1 Tax=Burkholderia ubonensis TaxID=101571 RepID=A0A119HFK0_9BURK|nr:hypothetical protein WL29_21875 [Burkholderia ubonensis]
MLLLTLYVYAHPVLGHIHREEIIMKVVAYFAVACVVVMVASMAMKSPSSSVSKAKTTIQNNIDARKAALAAI